MKIVVKILLVILLLSLVTSCVLLINDKINGDVGNNNEIINNPANSSVNWSELSYVAYGDSITYGADYTNGFKQMASPYPKLVGEKLGLKQVFNYGVSGSTYVDSSLYGKNYRCEAQRILDITTHYDIVSVMLGVNDFVVELPIGKSNDKTLGTLYGALNLLVEHFKKCYSNSFVFFMTPYKMDISSRGGLHYLSNNSQGYNLKAVADVIKEVAKKNGFPVLDMYEYGGFEKVMNNEGVDGVHPNQDFVEAYTSPQIAQFIKKNYR